MDTHKAVRLAALQEQVIVEAAIRWHHADTVGDIDRACENLHAAVAAYIAALPQPE